MAPPAIACLCLCLALYAKHAHAGNDEAAVQALANETGLSIDYLKRVRQVLHPSPSSSAVFSPVAIQEKEGRENSTEMRPSIFVLNKKLLPYLYKGDLLLTEQQLDILEKELTGKSSRAKRLAPITWANLWDTRKPIPYRFEDNIPQSGIDAIQNAIEILTKRSCLSFVKNTSSDYGLSFFSGGGCYSYIGQIRGWQQVSIGRGCEITPIAAHEILHALGSDHEQDRSDREDYVRINKDVIPLDLQGNFQLRSTLDNNNLGIPYDFGSIMHYGAYDFSTDDKTPSIIAKDALYTSGMGQRRTIAFNDLKSLNILYSCTNKCTSPPSCQNGGYIDPKNCSVCICPTFFKGVSCETPVFNYDLPAKTRLSAIYFSQKNDSLRTAWSEWSNYDKSSAKIITAPAGMRLNVTVKELLTDNDCQRACPRVGIEIVEGDDLTRGGKIFCCSADVGTSFITTSRSLGIKAYNSPGIPFNVTIAITAV